MKRVSVSLFVCLTVIAFLVPAVAAQDGRPPEVLARIFHIEGKAGAGPQLEAAIASHAKWRMEHKDPWRWDIYQVVNGDALGDYFIYSGEHTWADFDAYNEFLQRGAVHFDTVVAPHFDSISSVIMRTDTRNVRWPEDPAKARLIQLVTYRIKMDRGRDFNQSIAKIHDAIVKADWPVYYGWEFLLNGDEGPEATLALPAESWAAMKAPEKPLEAMLAEVYGEEEARTLLERFVSSVASESSLVVLHRPDLSVTAAP